MDKDGYIYIYKCIVGTNTNICKIGKTKNIVQRLQQNLRTPYFGFIPYTNFVDGTIIATVFKVKNYNKIDKEIMDMFKDVRIGKLEIYNIEYDDAIKQIYTLVQNEKRLISITEDSYTDYSFLNENSKESEDEDTSKKVFEELRNKLESKYNDKLPEELELMLRDEKEFKENCKSHSEHGNFIEFSNNKILDIHYNKIGRLNIKEKLTKILNKD